MSEYIRGGLPAAASTVSIMPPDGTDPGKLDSLLAGNLRRDGFAVAAPGEAVPGVHVIKFIVGLLDGNIMVRLSVDQSEASCLFARDQGGTLQQASPLTVLDAGQVDIKLPSTPRPVSRIMTAAGTPAATANDDALAARIQQVREQYGPATMPATVPAARVQSASAVVSRASTVSPTAATAPATGQTPKSAPDKTDSPTPLGITRAPTIAAVQAQPLPPPEPRWTLHAGDLIGKALKAWGDSSGWTVIWKAPIDWPAPTTTQFTGTFQKVAEAVIVALRADGAGIRAQAYIPNTTLVVSATGDDHHGGQP